MVEPFFMWRDFYVASEDPQSPFFEREYSEFEFEHQVYNYVIHPQWDNIGSATLYIKIIYVDYDQGYCIMEMIGEWNDAIENDIMTLKRDIIEPIMQCGIEKFVLIGENVLNFHYSDDSYYEEWFEELDNGWVAMINFHEHVLREFANIHLDQFMAMGGELDELDWRTFKPQQLFQKVDELIEERWA